MGKITAVNRSGNKGDSIKNQNLSLLLKKAESKLEKKKKELLNVKATHKKLAGEFIDLWVEVKE